MQNEVQRIRSLVQADVQKRRRMKQVKWLSLFLIAGLLLHLYWIQLGAPHSYGRREVDLITMAQRQQQQLVLKQPVRGDILDRDGHSLLASTQQAVFVYPELIGSLNEQQIRKLSSTLEMTPGSLERLIVGNVEPHILKRGSEPLTLPADKAAAVKKLSLPGVMLIPQVTRVSPEMLAKHAIGFTAQNPEQLKRRYEEELNAGLLKENTPIGQAGLEAAFDPFLLNMDPEGGLKVSYTTDRQGHPLYGFQVSVEEASQKYPLSVRTTLDREIQAVVEQVLEEVGIKEGAAVVLDVRNADILAMASRPDFDPDRLQPEEDNWNNRAVKETIPGSVFKTVIAAAALEEGIAELDREFFCSGKLGRFGFQCWKEGGHGALSFAEGYAQSCNLVFAQLAMELGAEKIEAYANRLGLNRQVGWQGQVFHGSLAQIDAEEAGQIFSPKLSPAEREDDGILVQTAIGQRDVRLTPLQSANMVVTIVNEGEVHMPRLADVLLYRDGQTMTTFVEQTLPGARIQPETAQQLQQMMEDVITEGTGSALQDADWHLAGKSGTGEYREMAQGASHTENQWFIGYGPLEHPRYAVSVVSINTGQNESGQAVEAFQQIMDSLAAL